MNTEFLRGSSSRLELVVTAGIWAVPTELSEVTLKHISLLSTFLSNYETVKTKKPNTATTIVPKKGEN